MSFDAILEILKTVTTNAVSQQIQNTQIKSLRESNIASRVIETLMELDPVDQKIIWNLDYIPKEKVEDFVNRCFAALKKENYFGDFDPPLDSIIGSDEEVRQHVLLEEIAKKATANYPNLVYYWDRFPIEGDDRKLGIVIHEPDDVTNIHLYVKNGEVFDRFENDDAASLGKAAYEVFNALKVGGYFDQVSSD